MEYIKRKIEDKFMRMSDFFKAVLLTGARQTGKTTMLKKLSENSPRTYVTLDNLQARSLAQSDPVLFFQVYKPPIIIDEIQYAPELFGQIKIMCDESEEPGRFWLTGSQQFAMMKNVRETLAGRLGILNLYSMTSEEISGNIREHEYDFSLQGLINRSKLRDKNGIHEIFNKIWRGGMPRVLNADEEQRTVYFDSYVDTYLMRDVAELGGVTNTVKFRKFLEACAALNAEQINYKNLADASDISQPTAKEWVKLLEGMGIIYLLKPYFNNELKRLTKTPKLYFLDSGLCSYLSMWLTPETIMNGAASGHYFESFVVTELIKNFAYSKTKANFSYYRDSNAKEIDLLIETGKEIHPFEIKRSANPDTREVKKFSLLDNSNCVRGYGGIICMSEEVMPIDEMNTFIPCNIL